MGTQTQSQRRVEINKDREGAREIGATWLSGK